jgi:hypothetical protein
VAGPVTALNPSVGATIPSDPTAPIYGTASTYLADDGTVCAQREITIAALPANAISQNLLYRKSGAAEWIIAGQYKNGVAVVVLLDDLIPGVTYDIACQAWSAAGGSNVVAGFSFAAATKTAPPTTPSGFSLVGGASGSYGRGAVFQGTIRAYAVRVNWTHISDRDFDHYEWCFVPFGTSQAGCDSAWASFSYVTSVNEIIAIDTSLSASVIGVRSVNSSGIKSAWAMTASLSGTWGYPSGDMVNQNSNDINTTGIKTGSGSVNDVKVRQPYIGGHGLAGGAPTETLNLSLAGYGFSTAPDAAWFQAADISSCEVRYDWDDSTSSTAVLRIRMLDGTNLPTFIIITGELVEY